MMLGPVERIEAAEASMPDMAGCLFAANSLEGWDTDEIERLLSAAGDEFRRAIVAGRHEQPLPQPGYPRPRIEATFEAGYAAAWVAAATRARPRVLRAAASVCSRMADALPRWRWARRRQARACGAAILALLETRGAP
jgi:hypothetical protein